MAWGTPFTAVAGNFFRAAQWNAVRDDLLFLFTPPRCNVYNNASFTIRDQFTTHDFNSERYDNDKMHSTTDSISKVSFNTGGVYVCGASISTDAPVSEANTWALGLLANDAVFFAFETARARNDGFGSFTDLITCYQMVVGDYMELIVYQNTGVDKTSQVLFNAPFLWAHWVGSGIG